jgi:hypothetical protein
MMTKIFMIIQKNHINIPLLIKKGRATQKEGFKNIILKEI